MYVEEDSKQKLICSYYLYIPNMLWSEELHVSVAIKY